MEKQYKRIATVLAFLCLFGSIGQTAAAELPETLMPGGMAFGVKLACEGLVVVGFAEVVTENGSCMPAYDAGLRINDCIYTVNGVRVNSTEEFVNRIENSNAVVEIGYRRDGEAYTTRFTPACCKEDGKYKSGM